MSPRSSRLNSALFAASLLSTSATAQNSTQNSTDPSCPNLENGLYNLPVNGSGTANVSDLILSVTFGESRNAGNQDNQFSAMQMAWLSAPADSQEQTCVWFFDGIDNVRQTGDSPNSCDGVIPQKCVDLMESQVTLPDNVLELMGDQPGSYSCPGLRFDKDELEEACGPSMAGILGSNMLSTGVQLPDGYHTQSIGGFGPRGVGNYDEQLDNFTMYDEYITRPHPMIVASVANGKAKTSVVCIAPQDVLEGSRVPAESVNKPDDEDDESAATGLAWGRNTGMAVLMASVAAMSFVLA
ncbi:hypothetical protein J4E91_010465 [Alternaria rosae]|nr:hypothetical protein J4E91_010465 [Alternaria rosae]